MPDEPQVSASPYAGRWVARLHGKIIAQGGTPEQALRAAQTSRHKERLEIIFMPLPFTYPTLVDKVRDALPNQEIYLVGGAVRDMILNRFSRDLDFAVPSNGISLARRAAKALDADFMILDQDRDTGRVIVHERDGTRTFLDFATYRGDTLETDLRDRDFTINAIAFDLQHQTLIDPLNGASDLRLKIIRVCSPTSLQSDPVRVLRAVRQAAELDFKIQVETRKAMKAAAHLLPNVSVERLRDELFRILEGPKPGASLRALEMLGVLPYILPELPALKGVTQSQPHIHDVWEHTLAVLGYLEEILAALVPVEESTRGPWNDLLSHRLEHFHMQFREHFADALNADRSVRAVLFFAALYHDVEKPSTRSVEPSGQIRFLEHDIQGAGTAFERAEALHLSNDEVDRIYKIVKNHMRFHFFIYRLEHDQQEPSRKAIYRFFKDAGEAGVDLVLLGLADVRGTHGPSLAKDSWANALEIARILLENYWERREEAVAPPRLLDGNELMKELHLQPGRIVGQLLEAIREEQAIGKVATREEALAFAREYLKDIEP